MASARTVLIVSFTAINSEPRVIRQIDTFLRTGWHVVVCGHVNGPGLPSNVNVISLPVAISKRSIAARSGLLLELIASRVSDKYTDKFYWNYTGASAYMRVLTAGIGDLKPELIIGHDYICAPFVARLATMFSCHYLLDIHEYATEQYMHSRLWRLFLRNWVDRIQAEYLRRADGLTTVCKSIAGALQSDYSLPKPPVVVRSVPSYRKMPLNCNRDKLTVLYHGNIMPVRGLESLVRSVAAWDERFSLVIRGRGNDGYVQSLQDIAASVGVIARVRFEQAVPFDRIIPEANNADIGYFVQENVSRQKLYTLPNKFFEYMMAGLALCVNDYPEMSSLVNQYRVGKLVPATDPQTIAGVINSYSTEEIIACKRNSLLAAQELCWENEERFLLSACMSATHTN